MRLLRFSLIVLLISSVLLTIRGSMGLHPALAQPKGKADFVRYSKPDALTFDELVQLEKNDVPSAPLAAKLQRLLTTPYLNNEAYYQGAKPKRPTTELGPILRAVMWNIERGVQFDEIRTALTAPGKLDQYFPDGKDPKV